MSKFWSWVRASGRNTAVAAIVAAALVAAAVIVPVALRGGGAKAPRSLPRSGTCADTSAISPPAPAAAGTAWERISVKPATACYGLVASSKDVSGISPTATFTLSSADPIAAADLVTVKPAVALKVRELARSGSAYRYELKPASALRAGTVYKFALRTAPGGPAARTWAFQVQDRLRVVQTLPDDAATDVPAATGIEITFSMSDPTGVEDRFSIAPTTAGRFETHKRTIAFVPKAALKAATLYTVTLKPGVTAGSETTDETTTFRFETATSTSNGEIPVPPVQFARPTWESAVKDVPALGLYANTDQPAPSSLGVVVYRYTSTAAFLGALDARAAIPSWASNTRNTSLPSAGLPVATRFTARLEYQSDPPQPYLRFPAAMPAGLYLVQAATKPVAITALLQVTDVATYTSVSEHRAIVWVNDAATGRPLAGATIGVAGGKESRPTDEDGLAVVNGDELDLVHLEPGEFGRRVTLARNLVVTAGGRSAIVPLGIALTDQYSFPFREYLFDGDPSAYWRYLYTDRLLYRTSDSVQFWGLVKPRGGKAGETLEATIVSGESEGLDPVARATVTTSDSGTVIGSLPLEAVAAGFYSLRLSKDGQTIASTSFDVRDFVTPAYKIDVTPSRRAVFAGERVRFDIASEFFEGTPVPNVKLELEGIASGERTTDAAGRASVVQAAPEGGAYGDYDFQVLTVAAKGTEEAEITGAASVQVFRSAIGVEAEATVLAGKRTVSGLAYKIDPSRIDSGKAADDGDYRAGAASNVALGVKVDELSYSCTRQTDTYDFIAKRVIRYCAEYKENRKHVASSAVTTDAAGHFSSAFPTRDGVSYDITVSGTDAQKRAFSQNVYVYTGAGQVGAAPNLVAARPGPFAIGDKVSVTMSRNGAALPAGGANRYLFALAQNGILGATVQPSPAYTFGFGSGHVPNVSVIGVRFNGKSYEEAPGSFMAVFDKDLRALRVEVRAYKARYRPGETAKLSVHVTDRNGKPVRSEVLLSAIDDAVYLLQTEEYWGTLDILQQLYQTVSAGVLGVYVSHEPPTGSPGGEQGGEGGDRDVFKDTGLFRRLQTDGDGRASADFKLPDNLTSWRVSAIAVSDGLYAGSGTGLVSSGLPVFADVALNTTYLVSDKPSIRMRAFGTDLKPGTPVTFTVSVPSLDPNPQKASGKAFEPADVALPALQEGTHKVSVTVEAAGKKDTIVRTITVLPSRLLHAQSDATEVAPGTAYAPKASDRRTTLVLADHNRGRYVPALEEMTWTSGDRVDQMLARDLSQELLAKSFGRIAGEPAVFVPARYQNDDGGIGLFPYSGSDLELSARVADLVPDRFGRTNLAAYFTKVLDEEKTTRERRIIATYGLAALGEPVLADVSSLVAQKDLKPRERLYAGLAAAAIGDQDGARAVFEGLAAEFGQIRGAAARFAVPGDNDDVLGATALGAILGAQTGEDVAPALFDYASSGPTTDILTELDRISFLTKALPAVAAEPVKISYVAAGKKVERELREGASVTLDLAPLELAKLDLRVVSGRLGVAATTLRALDVKTVKPDADVTVKRMYEGQTDPISIRADQLVRIALDFTIAKRAEDGCYQISDLLPSGLRPVTRTFERGVDEPDALAPYSIDGQRVSFCVSKGSKYSQVAYYARAIGTGTFTAEPAVMQSERAPQSMALTGSSGVTIK